MLSHTRIHKYTQVSAERVQLVVSLQRTAMVGTETLLCFDIRQSFIVYDTLMMCNL